MRILFLADNFPPEVNAQASRVFERARLWVQWGHTVTVLTCAPNFPEGKVYSGYKNHWHRTEEMSGIRVVRVKTFVAPNTGVVLRVLDFLSFMVAAFCAGLFQPRPDIVVATSPQFFAAVGGCSLAWVKRRPFVMELSDLWPDSIVAVGLMKKSLALRLLERLELFMYARATAIVAQTPAFKSNLVRRGVPAEKIAVVLNGVDLERFQPVERDAELAETWGIAPDEFVVSYIGTLGLAHELERVLECAHLLRDTKVRFLLVGPGADRERLVAKARSMELRNVTFVPFQPKENILGFWGISNVALVHLKNTPLFETVIPSKIFEAMAMGLPILLVSPAGEASRIVQVEDVGVWVPAGDLEAFVTSIRLLQGDPGFRERLASNSRLAAPRYSRERQAREMMSCLEQAAVPRTTPKVAAAAEFEGPE